MSIDFSQKERAFVDGLAADTGRDLDGWMAAIGGAGLSHRNEIIDWLRQNGFTFARASWIERIHHNGGKLIYADGVRAPAESHKRKAVKAAGEARPAGMRAQAQVASTLVLTAQSDHDVDALLAAGKAYRPLAQVLLRDILSAVPGADVRALNGHIVATHARPFAALIAGPKDVRLLLSLGTRSPAAGWARAKVQPGLEKLSALTHVLVLTDARQLTRELKDLIAASARDTAQ
ncbi:MAG: hypothetical protein ABL901_07285 [Hyphomicrobiaceae bacterium]